MNFYTASAACLMALTLLAQAPPHDQPFEVPLTGPNLQHWPKSCQRLHLEVDKCENGLKSCDQRRVDYWRRRCAKDEPHGQ